jgi:predicted nucleic acid-binding protein
MILPDTSIWIDHFRRENAALVALLESGDVLCHPFVIGEIACGGLKERRRTLDLLMTLESGPLADHDEVLALVDRHRLTATGLGWLDAHLLASTLLARARLWTLDAPLARAATKLAVLFQA